MSTENKNKLVRGVITAALIAEGVNYGYSLVTHHDVSHALSKEVMMALAGDPNSDFANHRVVVDSTPNSLLSPTAAMVYTETPFVLPTATLPPATPTREATSTPMPKEYPTCPDNPNNCVLKPEDLIGPNAPYFKWLQTLPVTWPPDDQINNAPLVNAGGEIIYEHKTPARIFSKKSPPAQVGLTSGVLRMNDYKGMEHVFIIMPEVFKWDGHPDQWVILAQELFYIQPDGKQYIFPDDEILKAYQTITTAHEMKYLPIETEYGYDNVLFAKTMPQDSKSRAMKMVDNNSLDVSQQQMDVFSKPGIVMPTKLVVTKGGYRIYE